MARRPRLDFPDTWHHLMNRGLARRTLFETDADRRFFLSLLAREVRAGTIELHAYSLMLTHYHLLVKSLKGQLSDVMRRLQNRYSRWFNRTRKRDGPLVKGRFLSRPIDSLRYRRNVVTYIHDNAPDAGLAVHAPHYHWASAFHYAQAKRPRWLATAWIDDECRRRGEGPTRAERLDSAFPSRLDPDFRRWVERQLSRRLPEELDDMTLKHAGSPRVVRWTFRKAALADGTRPWRPVAPPNRVERAVDRALEKLGPLLRDFAHRTKDAWINLRAGLLRVLAGCTQREIGLRMARHDSTVCRDLQKHRLLERDDPGYAELSSRLAHAVLNAAGA